MDPISNVDHLILLLRQRLKEKAANRPVVRPARASTKSETHSVAAAAALAELADADDHQLRRTLVQGLLSDTLGRRLVNEARFQQVVDKVLAALEGDEAGKALLDRVAAELRSATR